MAIRVMLSSYNMGEATEQDFDDWAAFVARELPKRIGVDADDLDVGQMRFGEPGPDRVGGDATEDQIDEIRNLLSHGLWEAWCSSSEEIVEDVAIASADERRADKAIGAGRAWAEREAEIAANQGRKIEGVWLGTDADAMALVDHADDAGLCNSAAAERWAELCSF